MESTLVRAFTKRRASTSVVSSPPPPPSTHQSFQRRQAALRQMGLLPVLSLSQQEAELDRFIPPSSPDIRDSEADRIKNEWVAKNNDEDSKFAGSPLPSPPLTPLSDLDPTPITIATANAPLSSESHSDLATAPLTPQSDANPSPSNLDSQLTHSPISAEFNPPDSPVHLHPPPIDAGRRSRSPSLAASESKSTRSRSKSRARSPLRSINEEGPHSDPPSPKPIKSPTPPPPQRKRTVFARFKRANTVDHSTVSPPHKRQAQTLSRSKSLFTSVRKTVLALSPIINGPTTPDPNPTSNPTTPTPTAKPTLAQHVSSTKADVVVQDKQLPVVPFGSSADGLFLGKLEFPSSFDSQEESASDSDHDRERTPSLVPSNVPTTGKGISLSLILNQEPTNSSLPSSSSPPASPLSSTFISSPVSPTSPTGTGRLRGRFGRKGTTGGPGSEGLLNVWSGVAGLLGAGAAGGGGAAEGTSEEMMVMVASSDAEMRQALAPTIHNEASILLHMSGIEDEETRRVTEVAFM